MTAVQYDGPITIAVGQSRRSTQWQNRDLMWSQLVNRLEIPERTQESAKEYKALPKAQRDEIKDVGGFVGGVLKGGRRKADAITQRRLLTLDLDEVPADADPWDTVILVLGCAAVLYSTHSHRPDAPRLRLVMPLSRAVSPEEYAAVARKIAQDIGIDMCDDTTYEPHRLMYWPSLSYDAEYDNAASIKGKGIDFAMDRLNCHLQRHFRKHGLKGGILVFDFKDYFGSAQHWTVQNELARRVHDPKTRKLANDFLENFGPVGYGLGSQISQNAALMLPNKLDHIIKEELRIKGYGRYMDDGYLIHEDIHYLEYCLERIKEVCAELGISLNLRKTKIRPITRGIVFLKTKFVLTETGRVLRKMSRASMRAMKRKLFKFRKWYEAGEFSLEDIRTAYDSFKGHMRRGDSFKAVARIDLFFKHLFGFHPNDKTKWRATNVPNRKRWDYSGADRATKLCRAA